MYKNNNPRNITFAKALDEIVEYFGYDRDKALAWYMTPSEEFDNRSPYQAIKDGDGQKIMKKIRKYLISHYQR